MKKEQNFPMQWLIDKMEEELRELYTKEDLEKAFNAGCAYTIGSHTDFKQTHPNFEEYFKNLRSN